MSTFTQEILESVKSKDPGQAEFHQAVEEVVVEEKEFDYVSKDANIVDYLSYAFSIFLIIIIGILVLREY